METMHGFRIEQEEENVIMIRPAILSGEQHVIPKWVDGYYLNNIYGAGNRGFVMSQKVLAGKVYLLWEYSHKNYAVIEYKDNMPALKVTFTNNILRCKETNTYKWGEDTKGFVEAFESVNNDFMGIQKGLTLEKEEQNIKGKVYNPFVSFD